jgi:hypothetical protein
MTLILMGDWCSEDIADPLTIEISARVMTLETGAVLTDPCTARKKLFLAYGEPFSLDSGLLMGDPSFPFGKPLLDLLTKTCFSLQGS